MIINITVNGESNIYNLDNVFCIKSDGMGHIALHKGAGVGAFDTVPIANVNAFFEAFEMAVRKGSKIFEWREGDSD